MSSKTQGRDADLLAKETDAKQIFVGGKVNFLLVDMARRIDSQLQTDRNLIWQYDIFVLSL
jgi:hypothetical protein